MEFYGMHAQNYVTTTCDETDGRQNATRRQLAHWHRVTHAVAYKTFIGILFVLNRLLLLRLVLGISGQQLVSLMSQVRVLITGWVFGLRNFQLRYGARKWVKLQRC